MNNYLLGLDKKIEKIISKTKKQKTSSVKKYLIMSSIKNKSRYLTYCEAINEAITIRMKKK